MASSVSSGSKRGLEEFLEGFQQEFSDLMDVTNFPTEEERQRVKQQGAALFDRGIMRVSEPEVDENDPGYGPSVTTLFSVVMELEEKGLIEKTEKAGYYDRAFQVIKVDPETNKDLCEFLQARRRDLLPK